MTVNVHITVTGPVHVWPGDPEVVSSLASIQAKLDTILEGEGKIMALAEDLKDLLTKVNDATNAVADRIGTLAGSIKNTMTDAEVADVKAGLQKEIQRLTELASDPNNPVPPVTTTP